MTGYTYLLKITIEVLLSQYRSWALNEAVGWAPLVRRGTDDAPLCPCRLKKTAAYLRGADKP